MDERKRKIERHKNLDFASKVAYVVSKLRVGEISEKDVKLASQLGNPVAQSIIKQPILRSYSTIFKQIKPEILISWGVEIIKQVFGNDKEAKVFICHLEEASRGFFLTRIEDVEGLLYSIRMTSSQLGRNAEVNNSRKNWQIYFKWRALEELWLFAQMQRFAQMPRPTMGNFFRLLLDEGPSDPVGHGQIHRKQSLSRLGDFLLGL